MLQLVGKIRVTAAFFSDALKARHLHLYQLVACIFYIFTVYISLHPITNSKQTRSARDSKTSLNLIVVKRLIYL